MKAQAWKIWISEGCLGTSHGMFYPIVEIYVPELQLAMNEAGFHIWDNNRYSPKVVTENDLSMDSHLEEHQPTMLREIELEGDNAAAARSVMESIQAQNKLTENLTNLFGDLFEDEDES